MDKKIVPVFFATDDNYAPLLGAAVYSLLKHANSDYFYNIHILTTAFNDTNRAKIYALQDDKSKIIFEDMGEVLKTYGDKFHLRDYYSVATYYRLFMAELFPYYDKAFYFDSDMIFLGDVTELYNVDLEGNLIAGVADGVMEIPLFGTYAEKVLNVDRARYINAGMLLMDLKGLREFKLMEKFLDMLSKVTYTVAQDQDYINVLLKDKIKYVSNVWNLAATADIDCPDPKIVHFKLLFRPWHYKKTLHEDKFWEYAEKADYLEELKTHYEGFSFADRLSDRHMMENLARMAMQEITKYSPETKMSDMLLDLDD